MTARSTPAEQVHEPDRLEPPHSAAPIEAGAITFWRSRYAFEMIFYASIALYFLLTEHRAHFFSALPFLLLLACPLMHLFMHHGHGNHAGGGSRASGDHGSTDKTDPRTPASGDQP